MALLDLTAELAHGMVTHPAPHLPPVEVTPVATHEAQRRSVQKVSFGTHVSTHMDAPRHAIPDGATIDEVPLDVFVGGAVLIGVPSDGKANPIDIGHLTPYQDALRQTSRIIIHTGWAKETWGSPAYFTEGPYLTRQGARYLASFGVRLLGMDFPNVDSNEDTRPGFPAPNHNILLGTGMILLENLLNLHEIPGNRFQLFAMPLRLIGGDGCPCRAIAAYEQE